MIQKNQIRVDNNLLFDAWSAGMEDDASILCKYQRFLAAAFHSRSEHLDLMATLESVLDVGPVADLLMSIRDDADASFAMARKSYLHPNGYQKLVLISPDQFPVPYELRMHYWATIGVDSKPDIHDHGWDFASHILFGRLQSDEYEVSETGEHLHSGRYIRQEQHSFGVYSNNTQPLSKVNSATYNAGDFYLQPNELLHRVTPLDPDGTCTLVLQGPTKSTESRVFCAKNASSLRSVVIKPLQVSAYHSCIDRIVLRGSKPSR